MPRSFLVKKKNKGPRSRRQDSPSDKKANISGNSVADKEPGPEWKAGEGLQHESGEEQVDIETVEVAGGEQDETISDVDDVLAEDEVPAEEGVEGEEGEEEEGEEEGEEQPPHSEDGSEDAGSLHLNQPRFDVNEWQSLTPEQIHKQIQFNRFSADKRECDKPNRFDQPVAKKPRTLSFHSVEDLIRPDPKCLLSQPHCGFIQTEDRGQKLSPPHLGSFPTPHDRAVFADVPPRISDPNFWQNNVPNLPRAFNSYHYSHWPQKYLNELNIGYEREGAVKAPFTLPPGDQYPREGLMMAPPYGGPTRGMAIHRVLSTANKPLYRRGVNHFQECKPGFPPSPSVPGASPKLPWAGPHELSPENAPPGSPEKRKSREGEPSRYHCESCGKSYSTFSGLSKHKQFHCVNQVKKQFNCKHCDKTYTSLGALKMHIRTHTLPCKCKLCGKAFSRPWLLQGHVRTHTGEKPFTCPHCGRAFADRSNLRAHLQTHTDIKKYNCKSCAKTFSRMSLLLKHQEGSCLGLVR